MKDRTSLIIAHRLSTIKDSDLIYVIEEGRVSDCGKHEDLFKNNELYKKLNLNEKITKEIQKNNF